MKSAIALRNMSCSRRGMQNANRVPEFELFQWLCEAYPDKVSVDALEELIVQRSVHASLAQVHESKMRGASTV